MQGFKGFRVRLRAQLHRVSNPKLLKLSFLQFEVAWDALSLRVSFLLCHGCSDHAALSPKRPKV